ncbi:MAG: hypothetical protein GXY36_01620 [Chloroflexi bacterium]|nr:hypothetical protein [Chloroflexota bacterium]
MNLYATLHDLRRYLGLTALQTGDDDLLLGLLDAAARLVERYTGRQFYPLRQTQRYHYHAPGMLLLRDDLLDLHALINGDGSALPLAACHLIPPGGPFCSAIVLDRAQAVFIYRADPLEAIAVEGTWGCHLDWANAWAESGDGVGDDPLAAGATVLHVTDADGPDSDERGPRFATGQLLAIRNEYLHVLAVDADANTLMVARGANGTTAAEHASGTAIHVYRPPADVAQASLRVAAWLYKQKDAGFTQTAGGLRGQIVVPPALPGDIQQILAPYVRLRVA